MHARVGIVLDIVSIQSNRLWLFPRHFETGDGKETSKIFSVPDFVGDACKAIASRIRGAVAGVQFDDFHKVSLSHVTRPLFSLE